MRYEGSVYRPPSEAHSLIVQATIGCSHNRCTFCSMYREKKFRMRPVADILQDLKDGFDYYPHWERIFLADGDALIMPTDSLETILDFIRDHWPHCSRVSVYGSPRSILNKSVSELKTLKEKGLGMIYLGVESGSDTVLHQICKGATAEELLEAGLRVKEAGIALSVMLISGIGGVEYSREHAIESASLMNRMAPDYLSLLTLMVEAGTPLESQIHQGTFRLLNSQQVLSETQLFLEQMTEAKTIFRCNHASNYLNLKGNLPEDRERLLAEIQQCQAGGHMKSDRFRRL